MSVAQPSRVGVRRTAPKDLVIWQRPWSTCWDDEENASLAPLAVIEWKVSRGRKGGRDTTHDMAWLRGFARENLQSVGYSVAVRFRDASTELQTVLAPLALVVYRPTYLTSALAFAQPLNLCGDHMPWRFSEWNRLFLDHFFNATNAGKSVRLAVDAEFLDREGADGGGVDGFLAALEAGAEWLTAEERADRSLRSRWHAAAQYWPHVGNNAPKPATYLALHPRKQPWQRMRPPFLPYVGLCAYAWTLKPDLHANDFFERLSLAYPHHGATTLNWTKPYWEAISLWSCDPNYMNGECGLFLATNELGANLYTGLALSQVLLRAKHIERLPEVFEAAGLPPNLGLSSDELGSRLSNAGERLVPLLGNSLTKVLRATTNRFRAELLEAIHDVYKEWDGEVECRAVRARPIAAGLQDADGDSSRISLRLVLVPPESAARHTAFEPRVTLAPAYWGSRQFFITDGEADTAWAASPSALDLSGLCFARESTAGTRFLSGARILDGHPVIAGHDGDERAIEFRYRCKDLRFLQWHQVGNKQILLEVEGHGCRTNDFVYVLVRGNSDGWESFRRWRDANPGAFTHINAAIDDAGNWSTYAVNLADVLQGNSIPLINEIWPIESTIRLFTLLGGERVRGRQYGMHRFFADDLPLISALHGVTLQVKGAEVHTLPRESRPDNLPGYDNTSTLYELAPSAESDRIEIIANRDHGDAYRRTIKIHRGGVDADLPPNDFALDECGRRASRAEANLAIARFQGIEVFGSSAAAPSETQNGYRLPPANHQAITSHAARDGIGLDLFERLRNAAANTGRLGYAEFRRLVSHIYVGTPAPYIAEALRDNAVIDIEIDHTGRWTYVHPRVASLCRLPTLNQGRTEFLLTGCYTRGDLLRLQDAAAGLGLEIEQLSPWGFGGRRKPAMPSRRTVACSDAAVTALASEARAREWVVPEGVPSEYLIALAADASLWRTRHLDSEWHSYATLEPEYQDFPPEEAALPNGPFRLDVATDPLTERHRAYQLVDLRDDVRRYARVTEPEWATWYAWTMRQPPSLQIPQPGVPGGSNAGMELVLPSCLPLPPLFARAMVLCSGYPAIYTSYNSKSGTEWLRDPQFASLPEGVIVYTGIPARLSDVMFRKLGFT